MYVYVSPCVRNGIKRGREKVGGGEAGQSPLPLNHGARRTRGTLSPAICRISKDQATLDINSLSLSLFITWIINYIFRSFVLFSFPIGVISELIESKSRHDFSNFSNIFSFSFNSSFQ